MTSHTHLRDGLQALQAQIFPPAAQDDDDVGNVAGQQPQPCLWTLPPQRQRRIVHTFTGARNRKSREAAHVTSKSTPLSILWTNDVRARYCHILRFLHFMDSNRNGDDRLWKIWDLFEIIRTNFSKFYNPSEHLAVDEVIVKLRERYYSNSTSRKNANVSASNSSNYVTLLDIHVTWMFTLVKTDKGRHNTWQQPKLQWLIWQG